MIMNRFSKKCAIAPITLEGKLSNDWNWKPKTNNDKSNRQHTYKCIYFRRLRNALAVLEDWFLLALLGVLVAICSLTMDLTIEYLQKWHLFFINLANENTHNDATANIVATYTVWTGYALISVILSALLVRMISPQAIGSGIPEMKTILRGVILKEYLTVRTLIAKMLGLTLSLGSGMPIGKEGPFVHIASVLGNLLSQFVHSFKGVYPHESRSFEMLAAACAVGVSSTFSAPVGGVLFSIEVTSVYFAVRNYWRGFFAATCSATLFRILRVLLTETEVTVTAFYQTKFPRDAFLPEELPAFAFIGVLCGFISAAFIFLQRKCILFLRHNKFSKKLFQNHWVIYPALVAILVASLTYPDGFGRYLGDGKRFGQTPKDFFADCTWSLNINATHVCPHSLLNSWMLDGEYDHFITLPLFIFIYFILSILTSTLPIPSGIFGPTFVLGAAIGRLFGEIMVQIYPKGIRGPDELQIFPGVYAIVGSAALCGGVTHTVSVAVIVFELTGQLMHILPVMIAVLIANAICSYLQPSIYDSAIKIKHLPYLPDIPHTSSRFHGIQVEQFMTRDVLFFSNKSTYRDVQQVLYKHPHLKAYPILGDDKTRILIGSCSRSRLLRNLNLHVGLQRRLEEAARRREQNDGSTNGKHGASFSKHRFSIVPVDEKSTECGIPNSNDFSENQQQIQSQSCPSSTYKRSLTIPALLNTSFSTYSTIGEMIRTLTRFSLTFRKSVEHLDQDDLTGEERERWEHEQLSKFIDFDEIGIDPAPFQLVEQTSLFKVHSIFSLLGLNRAYVTNCGRLIGVVALKDLRIAIEKVHSGELVSIQPRIFEGPSLDNQKMDGQHCVEQHQQQNKLKQEELSEIDDKDEANDILNPCLEMISNVSSTVNSADIQRKKAPSESIHSQVQRKASAALKDAIEIFTKRVLSRQSSAGERQTVVKTQSQKHETAEKNNAHRTSSLSHKAINENINCISAIRKSPPIFVISSTDDDESMTSEQLVQEMEGPSEVIVVPAQRKHVAGNTDPGEIHNATVQPTTGSFCRDSRIRRTFIARQNGNKLKNESIPKFCTI